MKVYLLLLLLWCPSVLAKLPSQIPKQNPSQIEAGQAASQILAEEPQQLSTAVKPGFSNGLYRIFRHQSTIRNTRFCRRSRIERQARL